MNTAYAYESPEKKRKTIVKTRARIASGAYYSPAADDDVSI
jgi:hypothetical protein